MRPSINKLGSIGLLGGSFDPVHNGHLGLAERAFRELGLSRILLIPNKIPPHKKLFQTKTQDRVAMLELAFPDRTRFEVERFEVDRSDDQPSYTIDTLKHLAATYPGAKIVFLIGEDAYADLGKWHAYPEHLEYCEFWVAPRTLESASEVRKLVQENRWKEAAKLIPAKVLDYLKINNLYDNGRV